MFHFPTFPPPALCVQAGVMGHYALSGFPIRKSPDQSLVAGFPGLIAGSYVLLRLLVPRHPPCALSNLALLMMLAFTVQFSRYGRPRHPCRRVPQPPYIGKSRCARVRPFGGVPVLAPMLPVDRDPQGMGPVRRACARSLRTQQRARPGFGTTTAGPPATAGVLDGRDRDPGRITSAPLMSNHLGTDARAVALDVRAKPARTPGAP
jgi:hypothetical protein